MSPKIDRRVAEDASRLEFAQASEYEMMRAVAGRCSSSGHLDQWMLLEEKTRHFKILFPDHVTAADRVSTANIF